MDGLMQMAWVTDDVAGSELLLSQELGAGAWTRIPEVHFAPADCTYRGSPADFVAHVSLSYVGDMQLELIQPVRGRSIYNDDAGRPAHVLHHVCVLVDDVDAACAASGRPVAQGGAMMDGEVRFAYVDSRIPGVPYLELVQLGPQARAFYAHVKEAARKPHLPAR